ncbi:MFS transporter [Streptomyces sp. ISID311]|uniref:MFS transporter n=1 Tax=Streptomyces sp. ISID311 TaxID=2601673 RepID=UPI0011BD43A5|nr:MFS transporter [Streptomyces sp. ISID311]TXC97398.1 MFS transporter [Streptomyces sp. ISID311]
MFRPLRVCADVPSLRALLPLSLIARIHLSALPVALSFLVADWTGSYAIVGAVCGGMAIAQAVAGPVRGRLADRGSAARLLLVTGVGYAVGLVVLVAAVAVLPGRAWPVAVLISFLTSLAMPPISQISRAMWPRLAEGGTREAIFTLEATGNEIVEMGGPVLSAGVVTLVSPGAAVGVCAFLGAVGAVVLGLVMKGAGLDTTPRPAAAAAGSGADRPARQRSLLRDAAFTRAVLVSFFLMGSLFAVNLSVVAWGRNIGHAEAGAGLVALWSVGSALGGAVIAGRGGWSHVPLRIGLLAVGMAALALLLPPVAGSTPYWLLALVMVLGGTAIAPSLAASNSRVGQVAPEDRRAEAFGWLAAATTGGVALAQPLSGWLLDTVGPAVAVGCGAAMACLAAIVAGTLRRPRSAEVSAVSEASDVSDVDTGAQG